MAGKGWDVDTAREAFAGQISRMAREIGDRVSQEVSYAATDIRQKVVEKPWFGEQVTPRWHAGQGGLDAYQKERFGEQGPDIHGNGPSQEHSPVQGPSLDPSNQQQLAPGAERDDFGADLPGYGVEQDAEPDLGNMQDFYGLDQDQSPDR